MVKGFREFEIRRMGIYIIESISRNKIKDENKEEHFASDERILRLRPAKILFWWLDKQALMSSTFVFVFQ